MIREPIRDGDPSWLAAALVPVGMRQTPHGEQPITRCETAADAGELARHGGLVCWALKAAGYRTPESDSDSAWLAWGYLRLPPERGCVVVYEHDGGVHAALYLDETDLLVHALASHGGAPVEIHFARRKALGYRLPRASDLLPKEDGS